MDAAALLTRYRSRAFDTIAPYRWEDEELLDYLSAAQFEYLRAVRGIIDASTPVICQLPVPAGQRTVPLDRRIVEVRSVYSTAQAAPLRPGNIEEVAPHRLRTPGLPRTYIVNEADRSLSLDCVPATDDVLELVVTRTAKALIEDPDQALEVPDHHALGLLLHMMELAYLKDDGEVYDAQRSALFGQKWVDFLKEAKREVSRSRGTRGTVAYGGI